MAGTATFAVPADFYKGLSLEVDGRRYRMSDQEDGSELTGGRRGGGAPIYYLDDTEDGEQVYVVHPVPTESGNTVNLRYVYTPAAFTDDDDEPSEFPPHFHRAIAYHARAEALGELEDDYEGEGTNAAKFDRIAAELRALRIARAGRDVARMRVEGFHF